MTPPTATLVTGGTGFLGSRVTERLLALGHHVTTFDVHRTASPTATGQVHQVVGDVRDRDLLLETARRRNITGIIHCAAIAGVSSVDRDKYLSTAVNIEGTTAVLDVADQLHLGRVVDCSSEEVYGIPDNFECDEDSAIRPITGYGTHKAVTEQLGRWWLGSGGRYITARLSWIYGAGFPRERLPAPWLLDAAEGRSSMLEHGADHHVDMLYVDDAAAALVTLLDASELNHIIYNVGSGQSVTLGQVASTLLQQQPQWQYTLGSGPLPDLAQRGRLTVDRITRDTAWRPITTLAAGLAASLAHPHNILDTTATERGDPFPRGG